MSTIKQRARGEEQKAERAEQILDAAATLFAKRAYEEVTLEAVGAEVGITRAALYRYYPSKETLFLALYLRELDAVGALMAKSTSDDMVKSVTGPLLKRPLYLRLNAILSTALERTITADEALTFKQEVMVRLTPLAALLQQQLGISKKESFDLLSLIHQGLVGVYHVCTPSPACAEALKHRSVAPLKRKLSVELPRLVTAIVTGYMAGRG